MRLASSTSCGLGQQGDLTGLLEVEPQRIVRDRLDRQIECRLRLLEGALGHRTLLVHLDAQVEELRIEVFDVLGGHVEILDETHDLVGGYVPALLPDLEKVRHVNDGAALDHRRLLLPLHPHRQLSLSLVIPRAFRTNPRIVPIQTTVVHAIKGKNPVMGPLPH